MVLGYIVNKDRVFLMLFLQSSGDGGLDGGKPKYLLTVEVKRLVL